MNCFVLFEQNVRMQITARLLREPAYDLKHKSTCKKHVQTIREMKRQYVSIR
jgi:hypothetical protein